MHLRTIPAILLLVGAVALMAMNDPRTPARHFTHDFGLEHTPIFLPHGATPHMKLEPGRQWCYRGVQDGALCEVEMTVLRRIRPVVFEANGRTKIALARILEERQYVDGELVEISQNYYAVCPRSGNIYNFGEDAQHFENGRLVSRDGSWLAGKDGAKPGLLMPQTFLLGARYCQSHAPGVSMDLAEHIEMGVTVVTPAGTFTDCIKIIETTPLEPDEECISIYAPDVGLVVDEELLLVNYSR